ncbi:MAG TPA: 3-hydroxyacyl-CoA dehydrogenase NAD-binding domain-containing protein, partial [Chitinophagaceae bacterium]
MMTNTICVCGAGTMGLGIAQLSAAAGFNTVLYEVNESVLENAKNLLQKNLQALVEKKRITYEEKEKIFQRINFTSKINECKAKVIIEAIIEKLEAKIDLFDQLSAVNDEGTILATNTSSLPVSAIANKISHPERTAGMHFFNPAPVMKL